MYYLHYSCFFSNKSQERKKKSSFQVIRVIQNHNPETEKDQKTISNFGLSSKELNRAVFLSFSTFHLLLLLLFP